MATVERTDLEKALKAEGLSVIGGKVKLSDKDRAVAVAKTLVKAEAEPEFKNWKKGLPSISEIAKVVGKKYGEPIYRILQEHGLGGTDLPYAIDSIVKHFKLTSADQAKIEGLLSEHFGINARAGR